jgi:two-component system sensor histidine kinase NblS
VFIRDKFYKIFVFPVKAQATEETPDSEIVGGVVIFHDITAERSIEEIREQFTSMIVHELRTPLSGINKISELLRDGQQKIEKKDFDDYLRLIHADSSSMLELVNDILDIAKLEAGKFDIKKEPTDIRHAIDNRLEFFKPSADDAKLSLRALYDPELPALVPLDEAGIKQVLNNLISNAIKFTKANGTVEILVAHHRLGGKINEEFSRLPSQLNVPLPEDQFINAPASIVVAVSDTGFGINPKEIKELFSKFRQLGNKSETGMKGTGLGLAIAKGIIEGHGGVIGVASEIGVGSVFFFVIPL